MSNDSQATAPQAQNNANPRDFSKRRPPPDPWTAAVNAARGRIIRALPDNADHAGISALIVDLENAVEMKAAHEEEYLTIRQLQDRYGLSRKAVERLPIPRHKFGGAVRVSRADVAIFEATTRQGIGTYEPPANE